ncbi:MAG: hypothetical protein PWQ39_383 [Thermacetogenium sp.]|nr:hypothetical protein [Thermacetogenium sp.]
MQAVELYFSKVRIAVVGCGGTGSYLVPDLARFIYSIGADRVSKFVITDGDQVEEKNLLRQNFVPPDLNRNKAEVLAERYGRAFGINIGYYPRYVETEKELDMLFSEEEENYATFDVLVGVVDNNRTRQLFHRYFYRRYDLVYIDAGNALHDGQVAVGVRMGSTTAIPPVGEWYPDILEDSTSRFPSEVSCAEAVVSEPQSMMANRFSAALVMGILAPLLQEGRIYTYLTTFNSYFMTAKSRAVNGEVVSDEAKYLLKEVA